MTLSNQDASNAETTSEVRKKPTQSRSKERVSNILSTAATLITQHGADQLKMSEIAKQANVPIGSVYQYFPNKSAIIRSLAETHLEKLRHIMLKELAQLEEQGNPVEHIMGMIDRIIDTSYAFYRYEPAFHALWAGVQADALLNDLEIQDTKDSAELLYGRLRDTYKHLDVDYLHTLALVICTQIGASLRFAMQLPQKDGDDYVDVFKDQLKRLAKAL